MIILNKISNKRLNREINAILENIGSEFSKLCEQKNIPVTELAHQHKMNPNTFLTRKFSLAQFMKICYTLDVSPTELLARFYDNRKVVVGSQIGMD